MSPSDASIRPLLTRRRLLVAAGVVAGAAVVGEFELLTQTGKPAPTDAARAAATALDQPTASPSATPEPPRRAYRSRPDIAAPLVEIETLAGVPAEGLVFLTPANGQGTYGPMIVDGAGELVWMRPGTGNAATNLRAATYRGASVLTWWEGANNAGVGTGEHVVLDPSYREVARIRAGNGRKADLHDLLLTDHGTALLLADASAGPGTVSGSAKPVPVVMDCAIQEVDLATGRVVFEWHSVDHIDVAESYIDPPTGQGSVWDYLHANSLELDRDGNIILSARNTSATYKIDRSSGRILWRLGGRRSDFAMGPGTTFAFQHDARRQVDGTVTIFDDGNGSGPSRGIVLQLDETAMTATLVRAYIQPKGLSATSQGNMQVLPGGSVLIGWGAVPQFSEFGPDGRLVLHAGFTATQSYRVFRFPWTARPAEPPALAVDHSGGGLVAFASWNGATGVASWSVLAGADASSLAHIATVSRTGFETIIRVPTPPASARVIAVRAMDASGGELATSAPVAIPA